MSKVNTTFDEDTITEIHSNLRLTYCVLVSDSSVGPQFIGPCNIYTVKSQRILWEELNYSLNTEVLYNSGFRPPDLGTTVTLTKDSL